MMKKYDNFLLEGNQEDNELFYSACDGDFDRVKILVEDEGADVNSNGSEALRGACAMGQLEMVKYFVEKGADIHVFNDSCFVLSLYYKHYDVFDYLFNHVKKNDPNYIKKLIKMIPDGLKFKYAEYLAANDMGLL